MADEPPSDMLVQLPTSELARMNLVSSLPTLKFKSPTLSFDIGMEPFPDLMFGSSDGGLSFVNGFSPELMIEGAIDESCPQNLLLGNTMNSFLDLMFESPKLKSLFMGADLVSQSPEQERNTESYRCLKVEYPRPALPLANGTGTGSSSASSLVLHRKHLNIAKLQLGIHDVRNAETRSTADSLIEEAVERKVKELDLDLPYHKLPRKVFTVSTIRVLKLKRCKFELSGGIDLPELRQLHLESTACDQESVQTLLSCCPLIEILSLSGLTCLTSLHVRGLPKLHMLIIMHSFSKMCNSSCVEIDAPGLRLLYYSSPLRSQVVLRNCEFLEELLLRGEGIGEDLLQYFLSILPNLEKLAICGTRLQHLAISHTSLTLLKLSLSWGQEQTYVELDTPNLQSFRYSGYRMPLTHAMTSINVSSLQEVAISMVYEDYEHHRNTFSFQEYHDYYNGFISKLKEFFDKLKHCRVIELTIRSQDEFFFPRDFSRDQILVYSTPFCDIKHLTLKVHADCEEFEYIIDQVLWMCHPQTLSIKYYHHEEFVKALHYKFMKKDDHLKRSSANSLVKGWCHYLEDFQVNDDESKVEINRDFTLSKVFKPKILEKEVRYKLKWRSQPL